MLRRILLVAALLATLAAFTLATLPAPAESVCVEAGLSNPTRVRLRGTPTGFDEDGNFYVGPICIPVP